VCGTGFASVWCVALALPVCGVWHWLCQCVVCGTGFASALRPDLLGQWQPEQWQSQSHSENES
jgi:hypothetical protein